MLRRGSNIVVQTKSGIAILALTHLSPKIVGNNLGTSRANPKRSFARCQDFHSFSKIFGEINLASSIAEAINNEQHCTSCGIAIQTVDSSKAGYIEEKLLTREKSSQKVFKKESDRVFDEVYDSLTEDERKLLLNATDISQDTAIPSKSEKASEIKQDNKDTITDDNDIRSSKQKSNTQKSNNLKCLRCHNALTKNEYFDLDKSPKLDLDKIIRKEKVPQFRRSKICHVISAQDFPHTLNLSLFNQVENADQITIVINKGDLVINNVRFINKYILVYFSSLINMFLKRNFENGKLQKKITIKPEQVIVVSSKKSWNLPQLYNKIIECKNVFFVGEANVGKSSLIRSLIFYDYYTQKKEKSTARIDKMPFHNYLDNKKQASFISNNVTVPGVFVLPHTTQDILSYNINNNKVIINDLPGFVRSPIQGFGIYNILKDSWVKHLSKPESEKLQENKNKSQFNIKKSQYTSIMDKDCYGLGGFAFLVGPENSITQVYSSTHVNGHKYSDLAKALSVAKDPPSPLANIIGVKDGKKLLRDENLKRYVIPPFHGSIDIVIKGLGYITIVPTRTLKHLKQEKLKKDGEKVNNNEISISEDGKAHILDYINYDLYEFYAPSELEVFVRESIDSFIYKKVLINKKKRTKNLIYDKKLKKMVQSKSYYNSIDKSVKMIDENRVMYSTLYEVPKEFNGDIQEWMIEECLKGRSFTKFDSFDKDGNLKRMFNGMSEKDIEKEIQKINIENIFWKDDLNLM